MLGRKRVGVRGNTWEIMTSPDLLHPTLAAKHSLSSQLIKRAYGALDLVTKGIAPTLDKYGIISNFRTIYRAYAEELWRVKETYTERALDLSANAIAAKYAAYGCDTQLLTEIGTLFGLTIEFAPSGGVVLPKPLVSGVLPANGDEQTVAELAALNRIMGYVSLKNMQAGDSVILRQYVKLLASSDYELWEEWPYSGVQAKPVVHVKSKEVQFGVKFTLQQTSGAFRSYTFDFFKEG